MYCDVCEDDMGDSSTYTVTKDHGVDRIFYFCTVSCVAKWCRGMRKIGVS